jgi:ABC-type sugar transport system permease subunit
MNWELVLPVLAYLLIVILYFGVGYLIFLKTKRNKKVAHTLAIISWISCIAIAAYIGEFVVNGGAIAVLLLLLSFAFLGHAEKQINSQK